MFASFVYQEPSSFYVSAVNGASLLAGLCLVISEATGKRLQYSKFWNYGSAKSNRVFLSSKIGMLIFYTPALLASVSSFVLFPNGGNGIRLMLLKSALTLHFLKRDLEVLFIHKFSGSIVLNTAIIVSTLYFSMAAGILFVQHLTIGHVDPSIDLKYLGTAMFLLGICGSFYHHRLLSKLRDKGEKGYKIPTGGLFSLVMCPHYLFEIITFIGISFISQISVAYIDAAGSALYLIVRSHATWKWYISKFENFPPNVKALIPYVF